MGRNMLIAVLCLLHVVSVSAQRFDIRKLDNLVATMEAHNKIMGCLTISHKGKTLYNKAWGYRTINEKEQLKTNTETKFRIGSISKMFTSVMILQLVEEKKLTLQTPLSTYFPTLPNADNITIEQMLDHHSGLYNFTDSAYFSYHTQKKTQGEMLAIFEQQAPAFQPGTKAEYSNTNFVLLGYVIEKVTGESYTSNVRKRITNGIGLKNTYYGGEPDPAKNEASSFNYDGKQWLEQPNTDMSITGGAGSLVSTSNDLVKFVEALFSNKLIKKSSLEKMITLKDNFGLGIFQFPFDEKYAYGHTGGIDEFHSMLGYFPEDSVAFAFTGNGETIDMNDLAIGVLSIYFNRSYDIPNYTEAEYKLAAEELSRYEGIYTSRQIPLKITIKKDGGQLVAQATGQSSFPLTPVNAGEFKFDAARLKMLFDISNKETIRQFTLQQAGGNYVFVKE